MRIHSDESRAGRSGGEGGELSVFVGKRQFQTRSHATGPKAPLGLARDAGLKAGSSTKLFIDSHSHVCDYLHMATNLALDDKLIDAARRAGKHKTKREAVTAALAEYVQRRKQLQILDAFGTFDLDPAYDYKAERRRRRP